MFQRILIANRGEIACRVIRTAHRQGIRCIAVYSDADRDAMHVALADEAYRLGPPPVAESYLSRERIVEIALASGAEAIHPGYGFLSENPDFVEACDAAGITFIGPPAAAIRAMGLKDQAKRLMEDAGVPVVPGYNGEGQEDAALAAHADAIGYPVLIKARAGGGGKGMRVVGAAREFGTALGSARREAAASFGDDSVIIERYLDQPRHIEIQVFADRHGQVVHLFERDCSLQRRHQKVIEEAPAPGMPPAMRAAMGAAAVKAAKTIGYVGAGTIEFIADVADGLDPTRFYFMEMNTRLQVEHPVTELITGTDLVEWQLRIAAGERLPLGQDELAIDGHAVEARLYAEDPGRGFLPSTGRLRHLAMPPASREVRIDTGIRAGDVVTSFYDPMIAKLIVHGRDRAHALNLMATALEQVEVVGCATNTTFLGALVRDPEFAAGKVDTGLIGRRLDALLAAARPETTDALVVAALDAIGIFEPAPDADPWSALKGWRLWRGARQFAHLGEGEERLDLPVLFMDDGGFEVQLEAGPVVARVVRQEGDKITLDLGDRLIGATVIRGDGEVWVFIDGRQHRFELTDHLAAEAGGAVADNRVVAPMPGRIVLLEVSEGESVEAGARIAVLEAMKMEQALTAPVAGVVRDLAIAEGEQIEEGMILCALEVTEP
ncbi:MAG TPA: acetyl/propionyl/methylcrotonyl-CoA carboxylase subunit alpha [Geminicoccaceae bacterium]|nr:acetyl/propionyl/methylcrotonyl-CoA carboxylase subunit alpha [Geminicoccaceae bacterium]